VDDQIISLTAQIVSALVANNDVAAGQIPAFIRGVHQALVTVGQAAVEPIKPTPAVAVKKSVFADHILCLDCGKSFKALKGHIRSDHRLTPEEYRTKWGLPSSYPMIAAEYAAARSKMAKAIGLGRKAAPGSAGTRGRLKRS
jgi:predicted transcriptional regulator